MKYILVLIVFSFISCSEQKTHISCSEQKTHISWYDRINPAPDPLPETRDEFIEAYRKLNLQTYFLTEHKVKNKKLLDEMLDIATCKMKEQFNLYKSNSFRPSISILKDNNIMYVKIEYNQSKQFLPPEYTHANGYVRYKDVLYQLVIIDGQENDLFFATTQKKDFNFENKRRNNTYFIPNRNALYFKIIDNKVSLIIEEIQKIEYEPKIKPLTIFEPISTKTSKKNSRSNPPTPTVQPTQSYM